MAAVYGGQAARRLRGVSHGERLLMVSNRAPLEHARDPSGQVVKRLTDGGVATALSAIAESTDVDWIACAATDEDATIARRGQRVKLGGASRLTYLAPPAGAYDLFYNTFCNPMLWFLHHGIWDQLQISNPTLKALHGWQLGYLPVNQSMAELVSEALRGRTGRVMFHDYHFYLAPLIVRNYHPRATLQHFVHIPWPDPAHWMVLPRKIPESICRGLLANDSVVFQTEDSVDSFLATCHDLLHDIRIDFRNGIIETRERVTRVWANPISADAADLHRRLLTPEAGAIAERLKGELAERTIVRVDRLDPAKNLVAGFDAYERLLERHPEWRRRSRFLAFLIPSRTTIPEYTCYTARVIAAADRINARFGTAAWQPVKVYHEHDRLQALVAMRFYDALLVNSLADGMNLVSKEGPVVNERNGVLVLSKTAGSYNELGEAALSVNPLDVAGTAEALHAALSMPLSERALRAERLRGIVLANQISHWLRRQLDDLGVERSRHGREGLVAAGALPVLGSLAS